MFTAPEARSAVMLRDMKTTGKAKDATRAANTNSPDTITIRWEKDGQCRERQSVHGWDESIAKKIDYLKTIDIEYTATWNHRHRYESTVTLAMTTKDRHYKPTTGALIVIDKNKNERTRQRLFDSNGRVRSGRHTSRNLRRLHHLQKIGGNMNMNIKTQWRGHQNTPQRNHP